MKVLKIDIVKAKSDLSVADLICAIHKFAEVNRSSSKIPLEGEEKREKLIIIRSNQSVSNAQYCTGYIALALYISLYISQDIAFVAFGHSNGWFEIWIKDPNAFIEAIS